MRRESWAASWATSGWAASDLLPAALFFTLGTGTSTVGVCSTTSWVVVRIHAEFLIHCAAVIRFNAISRVAEKINWITFLLTREARATPVSVRLAANYVAVLIITSLFGEPVAFSNILLDERRLEVT